MVRTLSYTREGSVRDGRGSEPPWQTPSLPSCYKMSNCDWVAVRPCPRRETRAREQEERKEGQS